MQTRVFALEEIKYDVRQAAAFGEIVYLFGNDSRRPSLFNRDMDVLIIEELEKHCYNNHVDCLLIAGNIPGVAAMCAIVGAVFGEYRGVVWNAKGRVYELRVMGMSFQTQE